MSSPTELEIELYGIKSNGKLYKTTKGFREYLKKYVNHPENKERLRENQKKYECQSYAYKKQNYDLKTQHREWYQKNKDRLKQNRTNCDICNKSYRLINQHYRSNIHKKNEKSNSIDTPRDNFEEVIDSKLENFIGLFSPVSEISTPQTKNDEETTELENHFKTIQIT